MSLRHVPLLAALGLLLMSCGQTPPAATPELPTATPHPELCEVTGQISFPADCASTPGTLAVHLFFENTRTQQVVVVPLALGQNAFAVAVPAGTYYASTWLPDLSQMGAHTVCQPGEACEDHAFQPFTVIAGQTTSGVDISDWYVPEGAPLVLIGTLIDGTGADPLRDAALVIRGERIVAVGPRAEIGIPPSAQLIELPEATILPGFINAHVHNAYRQPNPRIWARDGVTTVRDLGERLGFPYIPTRDRLRADPENAYVIAAGPLVTVPGGYPIAGNNFPSLTVTSPEDARRKIGQLIDDGADVIKITLTSGSAPTLSPEEAATIVETAHLRGVPVAAHATSAQDIQRALDAAVDDIAHIATDRVSDEVIQRMVNRDVYWVPTFEALEGKGRDNLRRFVEAGGHVALGNDAGYLEGLEIGMPIREITWMHKAGMPPVQIIVAATRDAAHVCNRGATLGTLEVGKFADVLVANGNPLQDVAALTDARLVIHRGAIIRDER